MNINCLFWNMKDAYTQLRRDFLNYAALDSDIIILAEAYNSAVASYIPGFSLIQPLQTSGREWIKMFKKDSNATFSLTRTDEIYHKRIVIAKLDVPGKKDIGLLGLHLNSKTGIDEKTQLLLNGHAAQEIHQFLKKNNRAILVGDFNHNPFEAFMNSSLTINSIPNRTLAKQIKYRTHTRVRKRIFYNPMWNFLGDHNFVTNSPRINGTYFLKQQHHNLADNIHWNLLDQVLVSEPIINCIDPQNIEIINQFRQATTGNNILFVDDSFYAIANSYLNPDLSDHLPLKFIIDTTKYN